MIDYRLKRCCDKCPYIEVKVNQSEKLGDDFFIDKVIEIYCTHEKVCKSLDKPKRDLGNE
ncbi:MAG: hypothetical protein K2F81_00600 [Ruminococcus sp.]|nr:hypothetical protein [Ruminococcus sp.]